MTSHPKWEAAKLKVASALLAWAPGLYQRLVADRKPCPRPQFQLSAQKGTDTHHPRVLVVSSVFPDPTLEAGSKALLHFVELLYAAGFETSFWSDLPARSARELPFLNTLNVKMFNRQSHGDFSAWFPAQHALEPFTAVVLDRPITSAIHAPVVRRTSHCRQVYYGQDIHHRRMRAGHSLAHDRSVSAFDIVCMTRIEQRLWLSEDVVLYPSPEETAIVNAYRTANGLSPNAMTMPLWSAPERHDECPPPSARRGMLFVGSAVHAPNIDGLNWFFKEVLPQIRASGVDDIVHVVGSGMEHYVPPTSDHAIAIHGWMDGSDLAALHDRVRVALAPLRYGSGVKGKVVDAMMHGVPCALTSPAAEGLDVAQANQWPKNMPAEFADTVVALMRDDTLWRNHSEAGLEYVHRVYGKARLVQHVTRLILADIAQLQPPASRV